MEIDDTREELLLLVGFRGPGGNLSHDFSLASGCIIEARSVDKCNSCPSMFKGVSLDLGSTFSLLASVPNFYSKELSYKNKDHRLPQHPSYQ